VSERAAAGDSWRKSFPWVRSTGPAPGSRGFAPYDLGDPVFRTALTDALADQDDSLLAAYVENEHAITDRRLCGELAGQTRQSVVHPVFSGSSMLIVEACGVPCRRTDDLIGVIGIADGNGGTSSAGRRLSSTVLLVVGILVGMAVGGLVGAVFLDNLGLGIAFGLFFGIVGAVIFNEWRRHANR
jgi:hypothetical protein